MPAKQVTSAPPEPYIVDVPDERFQPGDRVRLAGSRGRFTFKGRRRNIHTGAEWLDVFGGTGRVALHRSVAPELVTKDARKS
jgi:hypothetical protein